MFKSMELVSLSPDYTGKFGDKRLDKRAAQIGVTLMQSKVSSIRRATPEEASQKAMYRFFKNEKVEEAKLIEALKERASQLSAGRNLLVIQDTTYIDLSTHRGRLQPDSGIGHIGNARPNAVGFCLHPALVIDASLHTMLGFSSYCQWARDDKQGNRHEREYKKQPIEDKEAYKWIRGCNESKEVLSGAQSITFIEDREGDIYEQFISVPDTNVHLIIRSRTDRKVNGNDKLYAVLAALEPSGTYKLPIQHDLRSGRKDRTAIIELRYTQVNIQRPATNKKGPESVSLYALEAKEMTAGVSDPICWRILTTHVINSVEQAMTIIGYYKCRWYIEQFFRLLKKKGFRIEDSELETGWAIRKLSVMMAGSVIKIMQMMMAYGDEGVQAVDEVYYEKEQECMAVLEQKLQTEKVKNPYNRKSLSWATWIIARLGGWKGTSKERPPGPICLKNGLDKFNLIYQGWALAKDVS
jgi:Transposase DNA-binding